MRELKVVGLDVDGKRLICEAPDSGDNFAIRVDNRLRAAVRGDKATSNQTEIEVEVSSGLRPKEIQSRIRAGASVEQVAALAGEDIDRIRRFASPVLLERSQGRLDKIVGSLAPQWLQNRHEHKQHVTGLPDEAAGRALKA